jgi:hypothetical protein
MGDSRMKDPPSSDLLTSIDPEAAAFGLALRSG